MTSLILVPSEDLDALDAARRSGADALVLDLGDAGAPGDRAARRRAAAEALAEHRGRPLPRIVRVAPVASGLLDADLDPVMAGAPDAVLLPGAVGGRDLQHLAAKLAVREAERGLPAGTTGIVAGAADTAAGVLALSTLADATPRLAALAWDAAALAAALGVGVDASPLRAARGLLVVAAAAAGVPAFDGGLPGDEVAQACRTALRDGFVGRFVRRPEDVAAVAAAFGRPGP